MKFAGKGPYVSVAWDQKNTSDHSTRPQPMHDYGIYERPHNLYLLHVLDEQSPSHNEPGSPYDAEAAPKASHNIRKNLP